MLAVLPSDDGLVHAEVQKGANQGATISLVPNPGDDVVLSPHGSPEFYQRSRVEAIPWTHLEIADDDQEVDG
jgi:hypothetical protein